VQILPTAGTTAVLIQKPDGTNWTGEVGEETLFFSETAQPGIYQVSLRDETGTRPAGSFAVNLFSPAESAIRPAADLQIGQIAAATEAENDVGQREWWPWLLAIALLLLAAEWWVHHRGPRLPKLGIR
jgi:hypothetical protein